MRAGGGGARRVVAGPFWYHRAMQLARGVCVLALLAACSNAGDEQSRARRSPSPPPPPGIAELPAGLDIPVLIDGIAAPPLTASSLAAIPPDFEDQERRAWKLARLIPQLTVGATVDAVSREGVAVAMRRPSTDAALQPVLFVTRRGEVVATLVDPARPFPEFHGQGGRLRRPGDTTPRVSPVVRLEVRGADGRAAGTGEPAPGR
jgi:hypothetical protein